MAIIVDKTQQIFFAGGSSVDLQAWKTERLADETYEYHAFVSLADKRRTTAIFKAVFMIIRITDPNGINSTQEYYMGYTNTPGSSDDNLTDAWNNRASLTYYRYDQMSEQFFNFS